MAKFSAIILSAGKGSRMQSKVHKQYLRLLDKPVIAHTLLTFEESPVDEIILVVGKGEEQFCKEEIVGKYHLQKVTHIVEGGKERYHSVFNGLKRCDNPDYVLIHDGARPLVDLDTIRRTMEEVVSKQAVVAAVPVKDTIKMADEQAVVQHTLQRDTLWSIQTPQAFAYPMLYEAYRKMESAGADNITDDAMVVEQYADMPVHIVMGNYNNLKITTPEDLQMAEFLLSHTLGNS